MLTALLSHHVTTLHKALTTGAKALQAATYILTAFHSASIGITTETTSNVSSTCVVLELEAGQPCRHNVSEQQALQMLLSTCRVSSFTYYDCQYSLIV